LRHLLTEIQECSAHSCPTLSDEKDCGASASASVSDEDEDGDEDDDADNLTNDDGDGHKKLLCLHEECAGKPKTSFKTWKDLVRHYTIRISPFSNTWDLERTDESNSQTFNVANLVGSVASKYIECANT
jgi:hypothetical protein